MIARENEGHLPGALGQGLSKPGRLLPFDSFGEIGIQNDQAQVVADVHRVKTALGRQWKQAVKIFRILRLFAGAAGDLVVADRRDYRDQATVRFSHTVKHPRLQPVVPLGHVVLVGIGVGQVAAQHRKPRIELGRALVHRVQFFSAVHHVAAGHESKIGRECARQGAKLEVPSAAGRPFGADRENVLGVGLQPPQFNVVHDPFFLLGEQMLETPGKRPPTPERRSGAAIQHVVGAARIAIHPVDHEGRRGIIAPSEIHQRPLGQALGQGPVRRCHQDR